MTTHQDNLSAIIRSHGLSGDERETIHNAILKLKELDKINRAFFEGDAEEVQDQVRESLPLCEEIDEVEKIAQVTELEE